jgi:hypothetical protein
MDNFNTRAVVDAITHPDHIPGVADNRETKPRFIISEFLAGFKVTDRFKDASIYVRYDLSIALGNHVGYCIEVVNHLNEKNWLKIAASKITEDERILENITMFNIANRYKVQIHWELWDLYEGMIEFAARTLILYAYQKRFCAGHEIIAVAIPKRVNSSETIILNEDVQDELDKKTILPGDYDEMEEKEDVFDKMDLAAIRKSVEKQQNEVQEIKNELEKLEKMHKEAENEQNFQKWKEETTKWLMDLAEKATKSINYKPKVELFKDTKRENMEKYKELRTKLDKAVRIFCTDVHSCMSKSSDNVSFSETYSTNDTINDQIYMSKMSSAMADTYKKIKKDGVSNNYRINIDIHSWLNGAIRYQILIQDDTITAGGYTLTFHFDENGNMLHPGATMAEFNYVKDTALWKYIIGIHGGKGNDLFHRLDCLYNDLKKILTLEENE